MNTMDEAVTLSRSTLVRLLDSMLYPNPDDPGDPGNPWGPYGPGGPVLRWALRDLSWVLLNPQPLPPVAGPQPEPWRRLATVLLNSQPLSLNAGPEPDPWRSAFVARMVIDNAVAQVRFAELEGMGEQAERIYGAVRASIREFVDDYCGTPPRRWPRPWPGPLTTEAVVLDPLELLVAGAQFHKAALAVDNGLLQAEFSAAADQLFEVGLRQMEEG